MFHNVTIATILFSQKKKNSIVATYAELIINFIKQRTHEYNTGTFFKNGKSIYELPLSRLDNTISSFISKYTQHFK